MGIFSSKERAKSVSTPPKVAVGPSEQQATPMITSPTKPVELFDSLFASRTAAKTKTLMATTTTISKQQDHQEEDTATSSVRILEAGAFKQFDASFERFSPSAVVILDCSAGTSVVESQIAIDYEANGRNEEVIYEIPKSRSFVQYKLLYPSLGESYGGLIPSQCQTEVRKAVSGQYCRHCQLPISWQHCYMKELGVRQLSCGGSFQIDDAWLDRVFYGFVKTQDAAGGEGNVEKLAWKNCLEEATFEGVIEPHLCCGYKRQGEMTSIWVRVPCGMSIVYRVRYCLGNDHNRFYESPAFLITPH